MTKLFAPFCSAKDGDYPDMNYELFGVLSTLRSIKIWMTHKRIFTNFGYFVNNVRY